MARHIRDYREEVLLNDEEWMRLRFCSDHKEISKSAAIREGIKLLAKQCIRERQADESGEHTED